MAYDVQQLSGCPCYRSSSITADWQGRSPGWWPTEHRYSVTKWPAVLLFYCLNYLMAQNVNVVKDL